MNQKHNIPLGNPSEYKFLATRAREGSMQPLEILLHPTDNPEDSNNFMRKIFYLNQNLLPSYDTD